MRDDDLTGFIETIAAAAGVKVDAPEIEALVRRSLQDWLRLVRAVEPTDEP